MEKTLLQQLLEHVVVNGCSDLHIVVNMKPCVRKHGTIMSTNEYPVLTKEVIEKDMIGEILARQPEKREELSRKNQVDTSYEFNGNRYRVNIFKQRGNYGVVIRVINSKILSLFDLGLPESVQTFTQLHNGLVLVTGPTGSGKSTTLASLIDLINSTQRKHILTVEDPIEYVHQNKLSIINQREVGLDVMSFNDAVKSALREDPDIVLVGEMRDLETIANAITMAETGHLVFGTLHTLSAAQTVDRVIDVFEPTQQQQIRVQLATVLQGVVCQQLIEDVNGKYACATEVMIVNDATRGIIREGRNISSIQDQITMNKRKLGTQTMDQSLAFLYSQKRITLETAYNYSSDIETMKRLIAMNA